MPGGRLDESVSDAALVWFTRLHAGDISQAEYRRFQIWRARSADHAQAFDNISGLWDDLDGLEDWALRELATEQPVKQVARSQLDTRQQYRVARWAVSVVALLLVVLSSRLWLPDASLRLVSDYYTAIGVQQTLTLADGSIVHLDADSALSVEFSAHIRRLQLHRGRALFEVAPDQHRTFEVEAANGTVKALGTVFEVYKKMDQVAVTVVESAVQVTRNGSATKLVPGQRVYYGRDTELSAVEAIDRSHIASWRRGKLMFHEQPLGEVIDEVNRYRKGVIFILNPPLRDARVSGVVDISNPDAVLHALQETFPIRMHRLTRYLILLEQVAALAPAS